MSGIGGIFSKFKAAVYRYSDNEILLDSATNDEPWGPTGTQLQKICELVQCTTNRGEVLPFLFRKLTLTGPQWRQCYKALLVLEYIAKNGDEESLREITSQIHVLSDLSATFHYKDSSGDHGASVRERSRKIKELLADSPKLKEVRHKANKLHEKTKGFTSDEVPSHSSDTVPMDSGVASHSSLHALPEDDREWGEFTSAPQQHDHDAFSQSNKMEHQKKCDTEQDGTLDDEFSSFLNSRLRESQQSLQALKIHGSQPDCATKTNTQSSNILDDIFSNSHSSQVIPNKEFRWG